MQSYTIVKLSKIVKKYQMMVLDKNNIQLKKDVFRLISGIENEREAENEVLSLLALKSKHAVLKRKRFNIAEKEAIEAVFEKYGVTENIWDDAD